MLFRDICRHAGGLANQNGLQGQLKSLDKLQCRATLDWGPRQAEEEAGTTCAIYQNCKCESSDSPASKTEDHSDPAVQQKNK